MTTRTRYTRVVVCSDQQITKQRIFSFVTLTMQRLLITTAHLVLFILLIFNDCLLVQGATNIGGTTSMATPVVTSQAGTAITQEQPQATPHPHPPHHKKKHKKHRKYRHKKKAKHHTCPCEDPCEAMGGSSAIVNVHVKANSRPMMIREKETGHDHDHDHYNTKHHSQRHYHGHGHGHHHGHHKKHKHRHKHHDQHHQGTTAATVQQPQNIPQTRGSTASAQQTTIGQPGGQQNPSSVSQVPTRAFNR